MDYDGKYDVTRTTVHHHNETVETNETLSLRQRRIVRLARHFIGVAGQKRHATGKGRCRRSGVGRE
jgi:hypothetical protein